MAKNKKKIKAKAPGQPTEKYVVPNISSDIEKVINNSVLARTSTPPVLMKVCRLCGGKEGPFLNIFDQDQITAVKIDQLMPFRIEENDDLPHKICFRCSAKLEELHEFVSKCIKTQENLHDTLGKKAPVITRTNTRQMWEEKLNKSNLSNDDICDALIKKAMAGIKDLPITPVEDEEPAKAMKKEIKSYRPASLSKVKKPGPLSRTERPSPPKSETSGSISRTEIKKIEEDNHVQFKKAMLSLDKCDETKRTTRSKAAENVSDSPIEKKVRPSREATKPVIPDSSSDDDSIVEIAQPKPKVTDLTLDFEEESVKNKNAEEPAKKTESESPLKTFNIMDHVCMIKVNGVGVLFQCKLCNRNFLKKEVVQTHSCAKNGVPKVDFTKILPPPEPPKIATVKYINTKVDEKKVVNEPTVKLPEVKPKPKIGPASRVRQNNSDTNSQPSPQPTPPPQVVPPVINFPSMPGLNGRFKLVPGPNNTFTLMEDPSTSSNASATTASPSTSTNTSQNNLPSQLNSNVQCTNKEESKKSRKRKSNVSPIPVDDRNNRAVLHVNYNSKPNNSVDKGRPIIDLIGDNASASNNSILPESVSSDYDKPYPVGMFQTLSRAPEPPAFTTPAMKKQSYTIVQTGNPSKLLISTKPIAPVEEVSKKRPKKSKVLKKDEDLPAPVTEAGSQAKDPGYFTFINVDPMVQTSYILPTDNIIQESQISTSTAVGQPSTESKDKEKYSCSMCNETFSREKKLLSHIHSHYSKMDEEDQLRAKKSEPRRRSRKS